MSDQGKNSTQGADDAATGDALDTLFAEMRAEADARAPLPPGLAERMMADALAAQPARTAAPRRRGLGDMLAGLGLGLGWPGAASLTASLVAGIWLGLAPPAPLDGTVDALTGAVFSGLGLDTVDPAGDMMIAFDLGGLDG